jgi:enoyl-CoA hydratase/carnithine racemase
MQGNGKAFCAGGDVLASYTCMVAGENHLLRRFKSNWKMFAAVNVLSPWMKQGTGAME